MNSKGSHLACEPQLFFGRKAARTPPDDRAEALHYRGSTGQGDRGPLWLFWSPGSCSPQGGLLLLMGLSQRSHFSFTQEMLPGHLLRARRS